jgi:hypothetical protein
MLQIRIEPHPIQLAYTTHNARLDLRTERAQVVIDATPARLDIRQPLGKLSIDQTPCRYAIGLKNLTDFSSDLTVTNRQAVLEGTGRAAGEGRRAALIENPANAFADIAADAMLDDMVELTMGWIPSPDISYEAQPAAINPIPGNLSYEVRPGGVQGEYQPGKVDIQVVQYPSLEITVVDVRL